MSSHHFVREGQEPALLIMDPESLPLDQIQGFLEWSPTVLVAEEALEKVLEWGIKIDVVICQEPTLRDWHKHLVEQAPIKFLSFPEGEDPLLNAIYFLISKKETAVNVLSDPLTKGQSSRMEFCLNAMNQLRIVFYDRNRKYQLIKERFEKWIPKNEEIQLIPLASSCSLTIQGLESNFENFILEKKQNLTTKKEGKVIIEGNGVPFLVSESIF
ncbi:hypothetical protein [Xanthovirga aplysinae]|uniref:hypothetical protein n=1 Tax=Xanthovirga aplysinae TaxID=2529853 RepID=UPI0012BBAD7F|nr:hypothetical protein [Xanthovirga aplysinae]MTI29956.1 hypothetical protein [Xanthovirga aplysinae]